MQCNGQHHFSFFAPSLRYGNEGDYVKAISDLESAYQLDPAHANAKKYLKEVYLTYAVK